MTEDHATLACGADLQALVEQVFDERPPADADHQRICPHCQKALGRIRAAFDEVRGAAAETVSVPSALLRSVMAQLRAASPMLIVDVQPRGSTTVSERLVTSVARRAALAVPAVAYASVITDAAESPGTVRLRVRLVASLGPPLAEVAVQVREATITALERIVGARATSVDVTFDDLV
jgi:hypothetical protein